MQTVDVTETKEPNERPRNEGRVRVRVRLRPGASSAALPGVQVRRRGIDRRGKQVGNAEADGSQELIVYASEAQRILDTKVEDRMDMVRQAYENYHRGLSEHVRGRQMQADVNRRTPPRDLPMDRDEWTDDEKRYARGYPGSPENVFRVIMYRSMRPLESIEILEHIDAPVMPEVQTAVQAADAIRRAMGTPLSDNSAELAELRKQVAALTALVSEKQSKKQTPQQ